MGFLRQKHHSSYVPHYTGLQIQTSSNSVPIAIVWGTAKVSPNVIWTGGFYSIAQRQGGGGKGGGRQITGYEYFTSFAMGVCEGPIYSYGHLWAGQSIHGSIFDTGITFARNGNAFQVPWPVLSTYFNQSLNYNGLAYVAARNYDLGSSPTLPQFSMEVYGPLTNSAFLNNYDADPALVVQDFLTNAQYGVGFPAASIDATTLLGLGPGSSYQAFCRAHLIAFSPALVNQEAANSILARWLQLTNTAAVWSGGKLKFIPYGDASASGGGATFNPNVTPIYNLADDDFIHEDGKDPLEIIRSDPYASFNWQRLNVSQRWNNYDSVPVDVWDQNAIELYGLRRAPDIQATEICDPYIGQHAAQLILQRGLYIRNTYQFKLSFEYCLLEPMDLVTVTDSLLGLNNVAIRITSIEEDDSGMLAVTAEEFPGGTATAVRYPVQTKTSNVTNQGIVPSRVNPPVIYEPPSNLTGGIAQVFIAASGGLATAYKLMETSAAGQHLTSQAYTSSLALGASISFSIYAQAVERTACRLNFFNGSANVGCDFNLATGTAGTPDAGVGNIQIAGAGGGWYQLTISGVMAAAGIPSVYVLIEQPFGTASYTGVAGSGIYIWGQALSWSDPDTDLSQAPSFLPAFLTVTNATLATNAVATPEGAVGTADRYWGGANVWLSTDNTTYNQVGQITAQARQGVLTASLASSGGNPDVTNTLSVSLIQSGGKLANATNAAAQNGVTLCLVDNELLAYGTAALTGANAYNLTYLYRGLYGTIVTSHSSGAPFVRVDSAVFQYPLPAASIGTTIYLKLQSFNIFGRAVEDLSECTVYPYTPTGVGAPLGPVSQSLAVGINLDYGLASAGVNELDDWGLASVPSNATIDLGLASS